MATAKPKRAPAWNRPEVLDLIGQWGEESVLAQLRASKRNLDIYGKISQGMLEKGHTRDAQQCRVKIKELRQSYQKARDANSCSGSLPKTCRFYNEVHAILSGNPTMVPPHSINTSARSQFMDNDEESVDKEEEEAEESRVHESGVSFLPESQDLFLTPEQSSSTQDSTNDPGEGTSGEFFFFLAVLSFYIGEGAGRGISGVLVTVLGGYPGNSLFL
ncbi:zinc finger and SCAN domain-containing protein 29-like [Emydura macquarii macquarii]|uniref:zinc finger and SCAN domain-containing protein 29-like n=1 Tax=Emydura macquarii macquarii TaxID=1129001 RepID=UPI00352BC5AA